MKTWLVWSWHLGSTSKIAVAVGEIVALWFTTRYLPLDVATQHAIATDGAIVLGLLLVFGIAFSRPRR